jgi:hypothetical protein
VLQKPDALWLCYKPLGHIEPKINFISNSLCIGGVLKCLVIIVRRAATATPNTYKTRCRYSNLEQNRHGSQSIGLIIGRPVYKELGWFDG